ncbi:tol-pal system-associated acyl-CoA thioesterase [Alishewanella sp. SMS8]|uniref:tol-pal system-associated acyl-CoA thioesterase n=1 Tax=Alishewanella sp. SMS8 TaxID=2994676 RepID=UPI0027408FEE|nr:tol-pal system-associated acyl-CoA thioesterase [Alishewanella sp. SMS8]MDP5037396.1 tol-pal system-associated acyl-CoA thioesterase [Alishewanella sp.]MDP5186388.1 tol-pal system-associated acyl-CoA thioesterase [Alishewanella sp.]MDP5460045.1 tol-pal system-associated acyl-CoA thioesterase [Alishewanella sp. SMS8]
MQRNNFSWPVRVYYEDTDAGGIVYYANYLKYFERARTEWLRALGVEQDIWLANKVAFVVTEVQMKNTRPAKFNELLTVSSEISTLKRASLSFKQEIHNAALQVVCAAEIKIACVDPEQLKARSIPAEITEVLSRVR